MVHCRTGEVLGTSETSAGSRNSKSKWRSNARLSGGPSQIETFDPKPDAPAEIRSVTGAVKTNLPGVQIGGTFERIAANADKFAFVRSFAHSNSGHGGGTHWVMTGCDYPAADKIQMTAINIQTGTTPATVAW